RSFEAKLAALCGVPHAVGAGSGSACILLALHACGVQAGDAVLMPANIYAGVPEAALLLGAVPTFVDIDEATWNLSADLIPTSLWERARAVVAQHTYGQPVDMEPLLHRAREYGVRVIEDAAHALGGEYKGTRVGGLGDVALFAVSNKGISACGVGGANTTRDDRIAEDMTLRRYHGRRDGYESERLGYNFRLTEMVAAVASCQLDSLEEWNAQRARNAAEYRRRLTEAELPVTMQAELPGARHAHLHFVIRVKNRDALRRHLTGQGIDARVHYAPPAHLHRAFMERLPYREGEFPVAETLSRECLSLPCTPNVGPAEIEYVVDRIADFYR
ncbi:MAG TPA: DegT/DnrJ/EryC1/StrS family aminotransferase, partial [bacterium]|nr:DegT/DnrJ/EryC1/StrS family aminotransferase [bacterium]